MEASIDTSKFDAKIKGIEGGLRKLDPALKKAETGFINVEKASKNTAGSVNLLQSSVAKFTAGLLGASIIQRSIMWLQQWGRAIINATSNLTELTSKAQVVFGDTFPQIQRQANIVAQEVGRASSAILQFATDIGAVISAFGITGPLLDDMSVRLAKLAVDMASFHNASDEEAFMALRSGLTGETEPLKRFGIVLTDTNLKLFALEKGIKTKVEAMNQAQKTALRYEFIMEKTALAQGDAARTADSFANQSRRLEGELRSLNEEAGRLATPILADAIGALASGFQTTRLFVRALTSDIAALIEMMGRIPGVGAIKSAVSNTINSIPGVQMFKQWNGMFSSRIGARLEGDRKAEASGELGAKLDALSGFDALGGATGSGGGGSAADAAERVAKAEEAVVKALGEQAKANLDNLKIRRKELEVRRDLGMATAKELRELDRINDRVEFQEEMVDKATQAWEKQKGVVSKLKDEIAGINEEIADTSKQLNDRLAEIDARASERKTSRVAELMKERDKIRGSAGNSGLTGDMSRRLGEIDAELAGVDPSLLQAGANEASLTELQMIDRDAEAEKAKARLEAGEELLESRTKLAEKTKELKGAENDLKKASDEVVVALDTLTASTNSNFTAIETRTKAHVSTVISELNKLNAAYSGLSASSSGVPAFAAGGPVFGPGTSKSDSIVARLSNNEHVITAAEVAAAGGHGAILEYRRSLRNGVPRFANGGPVTNDNSRKAEIIINNHGRAAEVFADPRRAKWAARTFL